MTSPAGRVIGKTYAVTVTGGQLDLRLKDLGGSDPYVVIEGLRIEQARDYTFDFGSAASPLASGYAQVSDQAVYTAAIGYGIGVAVGGSIYALNRWHQHRQEAPIPDTPLVPELKAA